MTPRASDLLPPSFYELDGRPIEPELDPEIESVPEPYVPLRDAEHRRLEQRVQDLEQENLHLRADLARVRVSLYQTWSDYDALLLHISSAP